jgi:ribosomal protein S18 acetylase RimI-like enzyme
MKYELCIGTSSIKDIQQISRLHFKNIKGRLSDLGLDFLTVLYKFLIFNRSNQLLFYKKNKKIIGFILITKKNSSLYKKFFFDKYIYIFIYLIFNILNFKILYNFVLLFFTAFKIHSDKSFQCELLSIVVDKKYRNLNLGTKLIFYAERFISKENIKQYIVRTNIKEALNFYKKNNFLLKEDMKNSKIHMHLLLKKI